MPSVSGRHQTVDKPETESKLYKCKSFGQTFLKVCGFGRQSLWTLSAESGTLLPCKTQEGVRKTVRWTVFEGKPSSGVSL